MAQPFFLQDGLQTLKEDMVGKPPMNFTDGDTTHGQRIHIPDSCIHIYPIPAAGKIIQFPNAENQIVTNVEVEPERGYILVLYRGDCYHITYRPPGLQGTPAAVLVIGTEAMHQNFDIPLRHITRAQLILRDGHNYHLAMYPPDVPVLTSFVHWVEILNNVFLAGGTEHEHVTLGMLEETKVHLNTQMNGRASIYNYSRITSVAQAELPPPIIHATLHDSWSVDLCTSVTQLQNLQTHLPPFESIAVLNFETEQNSLERIAVYENTMMFISNEHIEAPVLRQLIVQPGQRYIIVCIANDAYQITCAPSPDGIETFAVLRVISLEQIPPNFIIPLRRNRRVRVIGVANRRIGLVMLSHNEQCNFAAITQYPIQEMEPHDLEVNEIVQLHTRIYVTPIIEDDAQVVELNFIAQTNGPEHPPIPQP